LIGTTDDVLQKLASGAEIGHNNMSMLVGRILDGLTGHAQNVAFLEGLARKGETDDDLTCILDAMMARSVRVDLAGRTAVDVCGTGGDMQQTFNISTTAAFVAAASGCRIAKHGNRSTTGVSGSADIFEGIGHDIAGDADPAQMIAMLQRYNICFMFAQRFHPAMRHMAQARKSLGRRTAFNILGPLANPARVTRQLVGVSSEDLLYRIPRILLKRGTTKAIMTVMSGDCMDELSTSSANRMVVSGMDAGQREDTIKPEDVGLHRSQQHELRIRTSQDALAAFVGVLDDAAPNRAMSETTIFNAAGALLIAGMADDMAESVETCTETVRSGRASQTLDGFVSGAGDSAVLEEIRSARR